MSRVRLDKVIIFDMEMTCWEDLPPTGETSEPIQIGIVEWNPTTLKVERTEDIFIKPKLSRISECCTNLTGINHHMTKKARPLHEVCNSLRKHYGGIRKPWMAWGDDKTALQEACSKLGAALPFEGPYIDLGLMWTILYGSAKSVGLRKAMTLSGLEFIGTPHRALDDAINTTKLFAHMSNELKLNVKSVKESLNEQPSPNF